VFTAVTHHHHDPMLLPKGERSLASVVYMADRLSASCGYGFRTDLESLDIAQAVLDELELTPEQVEFIKTNLPQAFEEIEATFG